MKKNITDMLWALGISGGILIVGESGILDLLKEKNERNAHYQRNVELVDKSVKLAGGFNGMITGTNAQDFLTSVGIDYQLKDGETAITLRPYLHNRGIEVEVFRRNPFSKVNLSYSKNVGTFDPNLLITNWINKKSQNPEVKLK